jgi:hypothetical protein
MVPGVAGAPVTTLTASVCAVLVPQSLEAVTLIFPFWPVVPVVTVIEVVPLAEVMDHPVGTDQLYEVALVTEAMLYTCPVKPGHCVAVPLMAPGTAGVSGLTVTANVAALLVPQLFPAVTLILPFCPDVPAVTVIEVDPFAEVIAHPVGTDQV